MKFLLPPSTRSISAGVGTFTRQSVCRRALWTLSCNAGLVLPFGVGIGVEGGAGFRHGQQLRWMSSSYEAQQRAELSNRERDSGGFGASDLGTGRPLNRRERRELARREGRLAGSTSASPKVPHTSTTSLDSALDLDLDLDLDLPTTFLSPAPTFDEASTFDSLGLDGDFVRALKTAFPNVKRPTVIQQRLVDEIMGGRDIILRDGTGSGKTFGLVIGLLNKPRMVVEDELEDGTKVPKRTITALFIVPHRDLAYQLQHWIEQITSHLDPQPPLASIAQVLVRGSGKMPEEMVKELKDTPPHIVICTPQAFLEVYKADGGKDALMLDTLSTVVVDELDYLVTTAAAAYHRKRAKELRNIARHPGPTREILDIIYARRKELADNRYIPEEDEDKMYNSTAEWRNDIESEEGIPQLVLSTATMRMHLRDYVFAESKWLNTFAYVKISGDGAPGRRVRVQEDVREEGEAREEDKVPVEKKKSNISHSILVVSDTGVVNVDGAEAAVDIVAAERSEEQESVEEAEDGAEEYYDQKYDSTESPFNPISLETIATAFACDVPSVALLVIPSSAPVQRAVYELRGMGVNAHGLDLQDEKRGKAYLLNKGDAVRANPTLLVATLATTRGLDLPDLTHVFVLGVPEGRAVDAYLHLAGRVGRFGRGGKAISVVEKRDAGRMLRILKTIDEKPVLFEQIN